MKKLKNLHMYRDAQGTFRCYLRRSGQPNVPLPGKIGSPEFMTAYRAALKDAPRPKPQHKAIIVGALEGEHVYFVRLFDYIKIGRAIDVAARIGSLQTASPQPLELLLALPGSNKLEKAIHRRFRKLRAHGEWFRTDSHLLAFIDAERMKRERGQWLSAPYPVANSGVTT